MRDANEPLREWELLYGAVAEKFRTQGIFSTLIDEAMRPFTVVYAQVKDSNKHDMAGKLRRRGFTELQRVKEGTEFVARMNKIESIASPEALFEKMLNLEQGKFVFRGQTRGTRGTKGHRLVAGIGREKNQRPDPTSIKKRLPFCRKAENEALREFKRRCVTLVHGRVRSDLEWLAIAQHHRMPTRMLDWTTSFLVAAHFALKSAGIADGRYVNPVVLAMPKLRGPSREECRHPLETKEDFLYAPPEFDGRIIAQKSVFTVHAEPSLALDRPEIVEFEIDAKVCMRLKARVNAHAIDHSMLFPDIDGIAEHLGWRYKWRDFS
jgi:hypothetical protein